MRVVVAPDCFGGTLSAVEAAGAIAAGWASAAPGDALALVPLSDGGPGLVDVLAARLPGRRVTVAVEGPLGGPVAADLLVAGDTAYVESAAACGLHLVAERDPTVTSTFGVGQLVRAALHEGVRRVVVGLGGSATNDGGAGMLAALGLQAYDGSGAPVARGGLALRGAASLGGGPAGGLDPRLADVELVVATDVDAPLLGLHGASNAFGPQKGATRAQVLDLDDALRVWADLLEAATGREVRDLPGAGAAGGLGAALLALGARREPGIALVTELVGLAAAVADAHLVVTGEGSFDASSLRGKVVSGVAALAAEQALPCLVLAGQVHVGRREAAAIGVESSYALADAVGLDEAMAAPAEELTALAARVAREWSRG
ncbi:MAG: glycerate kinase [Mycobacteriales bacterium]|nr:glycerate kinase [Mycobacteriales bacterium]